MLEELLNKLIEKGRVPFGIYGNGDLEGERIYIEEQDEYTNEYRNKVYWINVDYIEFNGLHDEDKQFADRFSLREIVSKGSGLWQFVCENRKYGYTIPECWIKNPKICDEGIESVEKECNQNSYEYYIIESALKDESELEEFLLSNIVIKDEE